LLEYIIIKLRGYDAFHRCGFNGLVIYRKIKGGGIFYAAGRQSIPGLSEENDSQSDTSDKLSVPY
jgi:hypothetical protein